MWQRIKPIKRRRGILLIVMSYTLFFGCADLGMYARVYPIRPEDRVTISGLEKSWRDYYIYYGGPSLEEPRGILFDPGKDEMTLVTDQWKRVEDEETLKKAISWIDAGRNQSPPILWKVMGPDDRIYGYVYTAIDNLVFKRMDEKQIEVWRIPDPDLFRRSEIEK